MAYALVNKGLTRPPRGKRYIHRRVRITTTGSAGSAVGTAQVSTGPGRIVALAVDYHASAPATTDLLIKADTTAGVTLFTNSNSATDIALSPVGTTAVDETRAATQGAGSVTQLDATSGGFPIRAGFFVDIAQCDALTDAVIVDVWVRLCTFYQATLVSQTGADGTGAESLTLPLQGAGNLAAVALDFQNMPATSDITIKADDTNGVALFTSTNSATDLAPSCLGRPAIDEVNTAAFTVDGVEGGSCFRSGLFIDMAQADIFTSSNEKVIIELWIDD